MAKRITSPEPALTRRQTSRAKREAQIQRWVVISTIVISVAVVGLVVYAIVNQQVIVPSRAIATVNGENITVKQFQDRVRVDLYFASMDMFGGNTDPRVTAQQSLDALIDEALIRQKAAELNITVSEEEVNRRADLQFGYDGGTPEPTSTPLPTREATKPTTPTSTSTFVVTPTPTQTLTPDPAFTLVPTSTATDIPTITPTVDLTTTATPTATPTVTLTPTATQTNTPRPTTTPLSAEAHSTQLNEFLSSVSTVVGLSSEQIHDVYLDKIRAIILREKVQESLDIQPDETRERVHAAHILVSSEEEATAILERLRAGENFETVASETSLDTSNAFKGGDLGWFSKEDMVEPFAEVAFATAPGTLSDVVQTNFGWHIIKVYDKASVPLSPNEQGTSIEIKFSEMVTQWREEAEVTTELNWAQYMPELPGA